MEHASADVDQRRIVWTCCKNNDGELGPRSAWERENGLFVQVHDFNWRAFDEGNRRQGAPLEEIQQLVQKRVAAFGGMERQVLAKDIENLFNVSQPTAYRWIKKTGSQADRP
jgi:hypothetical protein